MASIPSSHEQERRVFLPPVMPEGLEIPDGAWLRLSGEIFATGWRVDVIREGASVEGDDTLWMEALRTRIAAVLETIDAQMSPWREASDLMRFNRAADGEVFVLPEPMRTVVEKAVAVADLSGGAFDPTLHEAVSLWGFSASVVEDGLPDPERIARLDAARRDWRALGFDGERIVAQHGLTLDLCGIAKGHAVDVVMDVIRATPGAAAGLVEIGGELKGWGIRPDGMPWWVELEQPEGAAVEPIVVALCDWAVASSGDYLRTFQHDGMDYCHAIDPRTLAPVRSGVASATVFDRDCGRADALATALMVLGRDEALALAEAQGIACLLTVREEGAIREYQSAAMRDWLDDDG
ncbi:MAG TPA: FAD:protein FMN transferase [Sphingobium sp.]|uniref:FAD:protein FMN transferase n=1 Tax=Sphingobium sp. TaxID=1912891 RepID=UPI002ED6776B